MKRVSAVQARPRAWFTKGRGVEGATKIRDSVITKVPLRRASTAADVANLVCYPATSASCNITGEVVRMDAGAQSNCVRDST